MAKTLPKADTTLLLAYLNSGESENAKTAGVRQFFAQVFGKDNLTYESAAAGVDGYILTRRAGLVQLRKYAEHYPAETEELGLLLGRMRKQATAVRHELHRVLVQELGYFA